MSESVRYPVVCQKHSAHCEECGVCRSFDLAIKEQLCSFITPPQSHPSVVGRQVKEWASKVFPIPAKS